MAKCGMKLALGSVTYIQWEYFPTYTSNVITTVVKKQNKQNKSYTPQYAFFSEGEGGGVFTIAHGLLLKGSILFFFNLSLLVFQIYQFKTKGSNKQTIFPFTDYTFQMKM